MEKLDVIYNSIRKIFPIEEFYLVGGCVRDVLLNKEPKDYDCCTKMTPDYMKSKLKEAGRHVYEIGSRYGSIGFKTEIEKGKFQYVEMTTYRSEFYNPKDRHPVVKWVGDLDSDLQRRDFCINALAYSPESGIVDKYGGRVDIFEKKIKCVGKPIDRFKEDPLRMLRAIRFATVLDFEIDKNVLLTINKKRYHLLEVPVERWIIELDKIIESQNPNRGIELLKISGLFEVMFPELINQFPEENLNNYPIENDMRYRALFKNLGYHYEKDRVKFNLDSFKYLALGICDRLKFSNKRKENILETHKQRT